MIRRYLARNAARRKRIAAFQAKLRRYTPPVWAYTSYLVAIRAGQSIDWQLHARLHNAALYGPLYSRAVAETEPAAPSDPSSPTPSQTTVTFDSEDLSAQPVAQPQPTVPLKPRGRSGPAGWLASKFRQLRGSGVSKPAAAILIQKVWRGYRARCAVFRRKQIDAARAAEAFRARQDVVLLCL